jgi:glycosyltransferase involved in cell wall biosynthesis
MIVTGWMYRCGKARKINMRIGFVSTRLAGVDGVSLETAKLVTVLEGMGHTCFYCAGELDAGGPPGQSAPAMHFTHPDARALHDSAFGRPQVSRAVIHRVYEQADALRAELERFVSTYSLDMIVSQNASAIPMNIALGVAIHDLAARTRIPTICHNHDFYWERERFLTNGIQDILDTAFPPGLENVQHFVINTPMQRQLYARRGIWADYLPNVFDFATPPPPLDDYAASFRAELGLREDDVIVLQPTRVIRRKAIEKAVELVRKLDDPRLILLITGYEGDEPGGYGAWLREEADRAGIRYRFIADYVGDGRGEKDGHRVYSLWDIYPPATLVTYPSTYEGFGNALVEALYFGKPVVVHTYAMYLSDIKPAGVQAVEFTHDITPDVLAQVRGLLDNPARREALAAHNTVVGKTHFSYERLADVLGMALKRF